jgi:uncharacterized membrane protein
MNKQAISNALFVINGLPLLIYPAVLISNIMSLSGPKPGNQNIFLAITINLFLFFSSTYLITYIACFILYIRKNRENFLISVIPLIHIFITILLGYLWGHIQH